MATRFFAATALYLTVACGGGSDASTSPTATGGDTIQFSYAGQASGTFDVRKSPAGNPSGCNVAAGGETWACAYLHGSGDYWVLGTQALNDSISTKIWFVLPPVATPGTLSLGSSCTANCVDFIDVIVNVNVKRNCCSTDGASFNAGGVVITSVGQGRLRGTFSGTYTSSTGNFTVANGYFNLRLRGT